MRLRLPAIVAVCCCAIVCGTAVLAQDRDPTAAPGQLEGMAGYATGGTGPLPQGSSVIVQNGKPFLVVGTRLFGIGQKVGNAKLVRITETEIWLQEGKQVTKVPRFAGIQRRVAQAPGACAPAKAASASRQVRKRTTNPNDRAVTPVAPCDGAQP